MADALQIVSLIGRVVYTIAGFLLLAIYGGIKALLPSSVLPQQDVEGKIVLITGAGGGFGRLLALKFAERGSRLVLWDMNTKLNEETAELCRKKGAADVHAYSCDISLPENVNQAADEIRREVGDVEILVNNAGIVQGKHFLDLSDQKIIKTMEVNAMAHFWIIKAFLPAMLEANRGHIVSIASAAGLFGAPFLADYCASKFAAVGLMESLKIELLRNKKDIDLTTVCPTYMATGMFPGATMPLMPLMEPEYVAEKAFEAILLKRFIVFVPRLLYLLYFLKGFMPIEAAVFLSEQLKIGQSMDGFLEAKKNS